MNKSIYLLLSGVVFAQACSTCPPCVPTHEIVEVKVPVSSCPPPPDLPPLLLPQWPVLQENPTADEIKTWYVDMVGTYRARSALKDERIKALGEILASYGDPP